MILAGMVARVRGTLYSVPVFYTLYPVPRTMQYTYAAELLGHDFRIIPLPSVIVGHTDYLFYSRDCVISTTDSDFHNSMIQLPRIIASIIEGYLRAVSGSR